MIKENVVLDVDTEKSSSLEVLFQDEIRLEFNVPLIYVKSGEEDIKQYVENVVKPDFAVYVNDRKAAIAAAVEAGVDDIAAAEKSAENDLDAFLQEEIKTELNNYVDTTVKSSLEDYGEELTAAFNENAADKTTVIAESVAAAADSATAAANSETAASGSAAEALSSAAAASGSAETASAAAEEAESWAVGTLTERPEGSAKYWAENAASLTDGAVNTTNISNCLTAVPQISLDWSDGSIVIAAGSRAYKPDGTVITLPEVSHPISGGYIFVDDDGEMYFGNEVCVFSGSEEPVLLIPDVDNFWFDTANNVIKKYSDGSWLGSYSLPLGYVSTQIYGLVVGYNLESVFSSFGYMPNTVFVLPGVRGLVPNGRNTDGSLKNISFETTSPMTVSGDTWGTNKYYLLLNGSSLSVVAANGSYPFYSRTDNTICTSATSGSVEQMICGTFRTQNDSITSLSPKMVFHAVDYSELYSQIRLETTARLPAGIIAAWPAYEAPSGWLVCDGSAISRATYDDLFAAIGTTFGEGNGSTTFELPDFRGDFLRGSLENTTPAIGVRQQEGLPNITASLSLSKLILKPTASGSFTTETKTETYGGTAAGSFTSLGSLKFNASRSSGIYGSSSHVTPVNNCIQWIIKY